MYGSVTVKIGLDQKNKAACIILKRVVTLAQPL